MLVGRVELVQKEFETLADKIKQVESNVEEAHKQRDELNVESYEFERAIAQVTEAVTGMEGEVITMQDIFLFERTGIAANGKVIGRFRATGIRPKCSDKINAAGLQLRSDMFDHVKAVA